MRTVHELTENELEELRDTYFAQLQETDEEILGDYTEAEQIPMSNVKQHYEDFMFVEEDFLCNLKY